MNEIENIEQRLRELDTERKLLLEKLHRLQNDSKEKEFELFGIPPVETTVQTPEEKISLFLKLFRCRHEVYPKMWENSQKGTKGYSPVCLNEWNRKYCGKPAVRCSSCNNQNFAPLDEEAVKNHLLGNHIIGTYAIDEHDNCIFLAADFDKSSWKSDASAYKEAAQEMSIDVSIEISRSGNGAHAWIFFIEPVPAEKARQLGSIILHKATTRSETLSLESYDRFFPNQDFLPNGGYGNLIALPLQKNSRYENRTVFVDDSFIPYEEQWEYLSTVKCLTRGSVTEITERIIDNIPEEIPKYCNSIDVHTAEKILKSDLADCAEYKETVNLIIKNRIYIDTKELPGRIIASLRKLATFANPEFFRKQKSRFSTWNTPKFICCADQEDKFLTLPRGLYDTAFSFLGDIGAEVTAQDKRIDRPEKNYEFLGKLYSYQQDAVTELLKHNYSVLVSPTGTGKTVMGVKLITQYNKPSLIIVHRSELIEQWTHALTGFIAGFEKKNIGVLGSGRKKLKGSIDIAMVQSLSKKENLEEIADMYDVIIVDECHHVPAVSFEAVLNAFTSHYFIGLTATPERKDGNQAIIHMQCGPVRYVVPDVHAENQDRSVIFRETPLNEEIQNSKLEMYQVWEKICNDEKRNQFIANDILSSLEEGRAPLVLTDRKQHIDQLNTTLQEIIPQGIKVFVLTGDAGKKERRETIGLIKDGFESKRPFCILATGSLIGEGFDIPELDTLFLAMPISFKGRLTQFAGRLHRNSSSNKDIRIYDYVDSSSGLTISMFKKRVTAYRNMSYSFECNSGKLRKWL